jgi:hypothetical protein
MGQWMTAVDRRRRLRDHLGKDVFAVAFRATRVELDGQ